MAFGFLQKEFDASMAPPGDGGAFVLPLFDQGWLWQHEAFGQGALALHDREKSLATGGKGALWADCARTISRKNFTTTLPFAMTIHNCLMCAQSWNIAKLSFHFACPWIRTSPSLLHPIGIHHRLTTNGQGHFTSSSVEEGEFLFTHASWSACLHHQHSGALFASLYTWPL